MDGHWNKERIMDAVSVDGHFSVISGRNSRSLLATLALFIAYFGGGLHVKLKVR